jgi:pimeloyl-ACP methyl ester carboxylesterase
MRFLYLHGFASGPSSRKAQSFRAALASRDVQLEIPDLAEGDFQHLTLTKQLSVVERTLGGDPVRLIGSSMGGYLASLYAAFHPEVERLVLLAPAFGFSTRWQELMGPEKLAAWRETGLTEVFHYGDNALRLLDYELYRDAQQYADMPDFHQPAQIFHGLHDDVVPISLSRQMASLQPQVMLTELDSDHELLNVLDRITSEAAPFLTAGSV